MTETPHLGLYQWSDKEEKQRPTLGSDEFQKNLEEYNERRKQAINTPEGQAWLAKHGLTMLASERLDG